MDKPLGEKPFLQAIRGKVIAASLLACLSIVLALGITYISFHGLLGTVEELSSPNEKIRILNNFFQHVTQLDQQQRAEAISNPDKPFENFLLESKSLLFAVDTLRSMGWKNPQQMQRLNAITSIITKRDQLFLSYLKIKSDYLYSKDFGERIDSLSGILSSSHIASDSSILSTQKKTTTTTYIPGEVDKTKKKDNRSFFNRLFSKKKVQPTETKIEVVEELSVTIDTLAVAKQDSAIDEVGKIMKNLEQDHRQHNRDMVEMELELINTNTILINQLLGILHEVEKEELLLMRQNSAEAVDFVNFNIKRIAVITAVFFLGTAVMLFLILSDISRSNYYKNQLIQAKEEAEELGLVKQKFLANMSHEIRTPLQSILGFAEQLKQKSNADLEAVSAIHSSSEHLLQIVNEVLDYSRIESGKLTLKKEPFYLTKVIEEVSASIRIQAEHRNLSFTHHINGQDIQVLGDAFRLRQILYNLLGNAIKFTTHGYVKLAVNVEERAEKVVCEFQISDTGMGLDPKDIDRVFEQFEQANASINHQYGGTGLGLTIVKKLVDAQGGQLKVESEPGKGSVFTVILSFEKMCEMKEEEQLHVTSQRTLHGSVMVVDDDPLILKLCGLILKKHNIPFITFQDSKLAMQYAHYEDIGLILLDIRMPDVNGIELCHEIRKKKKKDTRIVALTAHVLPVEKSGLIKECFDEIFTKPFREQELINFIGITASSLTNQHEKESDDDDDSYDLSSIKNMIMGDEALLQSIIHQFIEETNDDLDEIDRYLTTSDLIATREIVHKLAGRTGQIGILKLPALLRAIEVDLEDGKSLVFVRDRIYNATRRLKTILINMEKELIVSHVKLL